jgi:hypothetical protein
VRDKGRIGGSGIDYCLSGASSGTFSPTVSVGTTMLLRIGDLWSRQTIVASPQYDECEFSVVVGEGFSSAVKSGSSHSDGSFVLPWEEHPGHMDATHSWCVRVNLPEGGLLLFPAMELIRFYFGSSSTLLNRLFTPPVSPLSLAQWSEYGGPNGLAKIVLADGIAGASAHDVARATFSKAAWQAAVTISNSCLNSLHAGRRIYPKALFPFQGATTLKVTGKWLSGCGQKNKTFIVFRIRSCSHPFPYKALTYRTAEHTKNEGSLNGDAAAVGDDKKTGSSPKLRSPVLRENDPSTTLAAKTLSVPRTVRFPDLLNKRSWTDSMLNSKSEGAAFSVNVKDPDKVALGELSSANSGRQVEIIENQRRSPLKTAPSFLEVYLQALNTFRGRISVLTESSDDGWTIPLHVLEQDAVGGVQKMVEPRRLCAFELSTDRHCGVLAVVAGEQVAAYLLPLADSSASLTGDWLETLRKHLQINDSHDSHTAIDSNSTTRRSVQIGAQIANWLPRDGRQVCEAIAF